MASSILYSTSASVIAVPSGVNRCIVVAIGYKDAASIPTSVTLGGNALLCSASAIRTSDFAASLWTLPTNMTGGNYDLSISNNKTGYFTYVLDHIDQQNPVYYKSTVNSDGDGAATISMNTLGGAVIISSLATGVGDGTSIIGTASITEDNGNTRIAQGHNAATLTTGTSNFVWEWSSTRNWAAATICFNVMDSDYYGVLPSATWLM